MERIVSVKTLFISKRCYITNASIMPPQICISYVLVKNWVKLKC